MVSPINYTLDVLNPVQASLQGFGQGLQISNAIDQSRNIKLEQEQKQRDALAKQQQQEDLYNFSIMPNKTAEDYANIITRYPQLSEQYKRAWDIMDAGQQQESMSIASQVYAALGSNNVDVAKNILANATQAYGNSGKKTQVNQLKTISDLIVKNPQAAQASIGMLLASTNPDKFNDIVASLGKERRDDDLHPTAMKQAEANVAQTESQTANNYSTIADRREGRNLQKTEMYLNDDRFYAGLDQTKQLAYEKLNQDERKIAQDLNKPETAKDRMDRLEKMEGFRSAATQATDSAKLAADLAKRSSANGGAYWDRLVGNIPGTSENTFRKDVETLKSQVFLAQIEQMRGLGALTEAEGAALKTSIASLDINQGEKAFKTNLNKISAVLTRAAKKAERNAELYSTKGFGYSDEVREAAKKKGISPAEMQDIANSLGW